jgi:hypothetical protein
MYFECKLELTAAECSTFNVDFIVVQLPSGGNESLQQLLVVQLLIRHNLLHQFPYLHPTKQK